MLLTVRFAFSINVGTLSLGELGFFLSATNNYKKTFLNRLSYPCKEYWIGQFMLFSP